MNQLNTVSFPKMGLEFTLNRVAFTLGDLSITWYGLLITIGIILAMAFALSQCKKFGIIPDKFIDVVLGGVVGGIIGARLYYVMFSWNTFKDDLSSIFKTWEGGMAIYGGLIGAILIGGLIAKWRKMRILPVLDMAAMGFLIGQSIGRWGNFVNVEAFGSNTNLPWGMTGERVVAFLSNSANVESLNKLGVAVNANAPVHPCFLYESILCALGFLVLLLYSKQSKFDGELLLMYTAWY
ncbi:MAG: prolipoprotein diacylglyceryl transferase, partial [Oscillospiraceae bacterium]